ncbi:MAG: PIN domain-containing protein [Phycisphaerales bacterium]|jgi:predicted nucleic acid-binding protein|nr:PIN domain-containing protein [Phycisphaerales bacterium]
MILLDTNYVIYALKANTPQNLCLHEWINRGEKIGISAIAWAEFCCGP